MAWTNPAYDWTTGETWTATKGNTHIGDMFDYLHQEFVAKLGQWTSHVPTLVQFGTVGKTVTYSRYIQFGKFVTYQFVLIVTGSGTGANAVTISLPVTGVFGSSNRTVGVGGIYDASANLAYPGRAVLNTTTTLALTPTNVTSGGFLGAATFTAGLATNDVIEGEIKYEAA